MDMLHPDGRRLWLIGSLHGVRDAFITNSVVLSLIADLVGLMRSAPTTTKSEPLSWLV